ncbi:hypothetical protein ACJMK2_035776 [Sinanodonta woodiana]|uniref:Uncharacterized protein n=1 Tax=Sinanodonta woodiana TaxID=1069815 RepID=A0ABD3WH30_SINWO
MHRSLEPFISLAPCPPPTAEGYKLFWSLVRDVSLTKSELLSITTRCGIKQVYDDTYFGAVTIIIICVIVPIALGLFMNDNDLNGTELRRRTPYEHDNLAYSTASRAATMDERHQRSDSILSNRHTGYNSFDMESIKVDQKNHSIMK